MTERQYDDGNVHCNYDFDDATNKVVGGTVSARGMAIDWHRGPIVGDGGVMLKQTGAMPEDVIRACAYWLENTERNSPPNPSRLVAIGKLYEALAMLADEMERERYRKANG